VSVRNPTEDVSALRTWTTGEADVRSDEAVGRDVLAFVREHGVEQTVSPDLGGLGAVHSRPRSNSTSAAEGRPERAVPMRKRQEVQDVL
jgi:hypothetical protein